ncbi:hypothetical protein BGZ65_003119 [Modicella reniformis]|uniref:Flavin-containing monooxygenase n=1 Tax=Modicella reniformis TaxID=1440133 RepID=A0A9P6STR2_9FUNG|nr:hypothetical protein BGZ65_003119 [Modicella reniformis]
MDGAISTDMQQQQQQQRFKKRFSGYHSTQRYPSFPGMYPTEPNTYMSQQVHSHSFREVPEDTKWGNMIVVGVGNSGVDLAVELFMNHCQVHLSVQSDRHVLVTISIPRIHPLMMKPKKRPFQSHTTINSMIHERISTGTISPQRNIRRMGSGKCVQFVDVQVRSGQSPLMNPIPDQSRWIERFKRWKAQAFGLVEGTRLKMESIFGPAIPVFFRLVDPHAWLGDDEEDNDEDDDKDQEKKKEGEKRGETARQMIWGYIRDERYLDSKYLKDESDVLLAKKKVGVKGVD